MNNNKIIMSIADIRAMCLALSYEEVFTYLLKNTIIATDNLAADWMRRFGAEYSDPRDRVHIYDKTIATWQSENPAATLIALKERWPNAASNITQGLSGDKKAINSVIKDRLQDLDKEDENNTIYSKLEFSVLRDLAKTKGFGSFETAIENLNYNLITSSAKQFLDLFQLFQKNNRLARLAMYVDLFTENRFASIKTNNLIIEDILHVADILSYEDFCLYLDLIEKEDLAISPEVSSLVRRFKSMCDADKKLMFVGLSSDIEFKPDLETNSDIVEEYNYLTISEIARVSERLYFKDFCNYIDNIKYNQITSSALRFLTKFKSLSEEDKNKKWLELKGIDSELEQTTNISKIDYPKILMKFNFILNKASYLPNFEAFSAFIYETTKPGHCHSNKVYDFICEFLAADLEKQKNMYLDCRLKATKKSSPKELFDLICLVKKFPNDQELGAAIRTKLQFYPTL